MHLPFASRLQHANPHSSTGPAARSPLGRNGGDPQSSCPSLAAVSPQSGRGGSHGATCSEHQRPRKHLRCSGPLALGRCSRGRTDGRAHVAAPCLPQAGAALFLLPAPTCVSRAASGGTHTSAACPPSPPPSCYRQRTLLKKDSASLSPCSGTHPLPRVPERAQHPPLSSAEHGGGGSRHALMMSPAPQRSPARFRGACRATVTRGCLDRALTA